jgi:hypothetical protein
VSKSSYNSTTKYVQATYPLVCISVPFPSFWIQIENAIMKLGQLISNAMEGEIVFHLSNPGLWIRAIKFVHHDSRKIEVMR